MRDRSDLAHRHHSTHEKFQLVAKRTTTLNEPMKENKAKAMQNNNNNNKN